MNPHTDVRKMCGNKFSLLPAVCRRTGLNKMLSIHTLLMLPRVATDAYIPLFKLNRKLHMYLSYTFPLLSASS